jgi:hypothetical protein
MSAAKSVQTSQSVADPALLFKTLGGLGAGYPLHPVANPAAFRPALGIGLETAAGEDHRLVWPATVATRQPSTRARLANGIVAVPTQN